MELRIHSQTSTVAQSDFIIHYIFNCCNHLSVLGLKLVKGFPDTRVVGKVDTIFEKLLISDVHNCINSLRPSGSYMRQ